MQNAMYEIYPVIDEMKCDKTKLDDSVSLSQNTAESRKLLQDYEKKPQLGFVSLSSPTSSSVLPSVVL